MPDQTVQATILWLDQVGLENRHQVGGKAAVLGALRQAGLPVPDGFCLPVDLSLESGWEMIRAAYHHLAPHGEAVAVRSSGVAEDSGQASFAGQYESMLNVSSETELYTAIRHCRQSVAGGRVTAYGRASLERTSQPDSLLGWPLGVLVQRQAPAEVSGVLFTTNPLSGAEEMVLEAHPGLGEALVAGHAEPVHWRLDRQGQVLRSNPPGSSLLTPAQLRQLAALGAQIEQLLGPGQDIEWAAGADSIWILQARPVTTQPQAALPLSEVWTRANVGEVLPDAVTPLTWEVFRRALHNHLDLFDSFEVDPRLEGVRRFDGRVYIRLEALLHRFCYLPGVTPEVMEQVLGVEMPGTAQAYHPPRGLAVRLAQGLFRLDALGWLPRLRWLAQRTPPLADTADLPARMRWTAELFALHLKATAYAIAAYAWLARGLASWLPHQRQAAAFLPALLRSGHALQSADQGRALWDLAQQARAHPEWQAILESELPWPQLQQELRRISGGDEFLEAFDGFLRQNGARAAGEFELATPRWHEAPEFVLAVLRSYLAVPADTQPAHPSLTQIQAELAAQLSPARRWLFQRLLAAYGQYSAGRENLKYRLMQGFAALRQAFLLSGAQLVKSGALQQVEDVFFLTPAEIQTLAQDSSPIVVAQAQANLAMRRAEYTAWQAIPTVPALVGSDGQPTGPETGQLETGQFPTGQLESGARTWQGIGCSAGVVTGAARVLTHIDQAGSLQPGEILVAPHTDPGWTPLFLSCRAVVTEIGGFLSHGATVAREFGIPCVVNVHGATQAIRTGDLIRVDGVQGIVTLLRSEPIEK